MKQLVSAFGDYRQLTYVKTVDDVDCVAHTMLVVI